MSDKSQGLDVKVIAEVAPYDTDSGKLHSVFFRCLTLAQFNALRGAINNYTPILQESREAIIAISDALDKAEEKTHK